MGGIEGSVGCGNGHIGETRVGKGFLHTVVRSHGVVTHMSWIAKLGLTNCFVAPEAWDIDHIMLLRQLGFRANVMLTLSVAHHIDSVSQPCYQRLGLDGNYGTLRLLEELLQLA